MNAMRSYRVVDDYNQNTFLFYNNNYFIILHKVYIFILYVVCNITNILNEKSVLFIFNILTTYKYDDVVIKSRGDHGKVSLCITIFIAVTHFAEF